MGSRIGGVALGLFLLLTAGCTADEGTGPIVNNPEETTTPPPSDTTTTAPETPDPTDTTTPTQTPQVRPVVIDTIATGLTSPWGLAFLPDGDALVSERDTGLIKRVPSDGGRVTVVGDIPEADASTSEGGLLGLAVHPDFERQSWVYAYYSTETDNRVVRMRYADGRLGRQKVMLTGIQVGDYHNGGRMAFGPDGFLYVTTGDGSETRRAQDRTSLNGKILRLTATGRPAAGNPFGANQVWSMGHRNVQGITWDDAGNLYASEFGQDTWDELNHVQPRGQLRLAGGRGQGRHGHRLCRPDRAVEPGGGVAVRDRVGGGVGLDGRSARRAALADRSHGRGSVRGEPQAFFAGEYGRCDRRAGTDGTLWLMTSNTDGPRHSS
jgi:glucose/arabinose dehydrogenase